VYTSPKRLSPGSRVAIVAPASPFKTDELVAGLDIIKEMGLEPVLGPNVRQLKASSIHAAPLMDRVRELMWAFSDPDIDGIICTNGGCGSGELLPYLDFGVIRRTRKVLLGMSDISALNNGILAGAGLCSINGQYLHIRLAEGREIREGDYGSLELALKMMMSDAMWGDRGFDVNQYLPRTVSPGKAQGHVICGNLDTFCTLLGTPFCPDVEGAIMFIEDVHKGGESISRLLIHCKLAGVFDKIAGVVVGEFCDVPEKEDPREPDIEDVLEEYMSEGVPCVYGYSFAHGVWTIPVPIGGMCRMDADTGEVLFDFTMGS
jgi:muramoyltetrapeptide carboxypeptidase